MQSSRALKAVLFSCLTIVTHSQSTPHCLDNYDSGPFGYGKPLPLYTRAQARASGTQQAETAQRVYAQPLSLPEMVLRRSISNLGDAGRMRSLFHKLREGEPISVLVLGGSIACGGDTWRLDQQWPYRVFLWINATFPHAKHTYLNSCKPATPSMLFGACLDSYVPDKSDLVLLEFTINDDRGALAGGLEHVPAFENEYRRGFERFLRKVLKLPGKPALLYLHVYQPWHAQQSFHKTAEMEMQILLAYYSIPTVSARNALYQLLQQKAHGFTEEDAHCGMHPNPLGHRYYADLAIASLQDHAYCALTLPEEGMKHAGVYAGLSDIPPPMLEENWDFDSECIFGEQLRQALVPELSRGWTFVDEGKPGRKPKLGFRTLHPNTYLVLQVDTRAQHRDAGGDVLLAAGYLVSYERMGNFSIACVSGCRCTGVHNISGTHQSRTSIYKFVYFPATQHQQCRLNISTTHDSTHGGSKVKIDTLMVATDVAPDWSTKMNEIQSWAV